MCPNCRAFITTSDRKCPYCDVKLGARAVDRRSPSDVLGGMIPAARFTTVVILMINFGLYVAGMLYDMQSSGDFPFNAFGWKWQSYIFAGQWWRLITAGFLHAGTLHILMNSWVMFDLGTNVEQFYGTSRMLVIYFVSNVTGFLASTFWSASYSVGASAALFGLIGAMIAFGVKDRTALGAQVKAMYVRWAIYMLLFGFLLWGIIDQAAHIGGLVGGFAVAYLAGTPRLVDNWKEQLWRIAAYVSIGITLWAFLNMFLFFRSVTAQQ